ncbi:alpha/beta fold hydrolase [Gloeobacter violaceus]|nr:alpha/beta hydrolase [Gloeobacter violaceus]
MLKVLERGAGEPALVFLHYFGGSSQTWLAVIERLADAARCTTPDLRGFGASEAAGQYAISDYTDDLERLVGALALTRYILVGHSMGGKIALAFAARQPAGLQSLVLVAPSPPSPEPMPEAERSRMLDTHGERAAAEETARKITARPLPGPQFEQVVADNLRTSEAAWRAWLQHGSREDFSDSMDKIALPVLVIVGEADPVLSPRLLEQQVVGRIAGARLVTVPDAGHLLPLEAPEATARHIRSELRRKNPSAT